MRTLPAANQAENLQARPIANVRFRVRCETLGHGEEVYWQQQGDTSMQRVRTGGKERRSLSAERASVLFGGVFRGNHGKNFLAHKLLL